MYNQYIKADIKERNLAMKKRISLLCLLLVIVVLMTGCADRWFKAEIVSSIDMYSPIMSSVPGFPLAVAFDIEGEYPSITGITFITNKGSFLTWEDDMKVVNQGKTAELTGEQIYWTPMEENGTVDGARIQVVITYFDKIIEVGKTFSAKIKKNEDGMYIIK